MPGGDERNGAGDTSAYSVLQVSIAWGLTSCGSCEPGKFSAQNGSVQCVDCNVSLGLYADVENAADCKRCVEEEVSTGKECRPVSEDLSLQVPAEVKIRLVARESTSEFSIGNVSTAIEVSWRLTAGDQGSETPASYIVMLSPDSDFPASNRFTFPTSVDQVLASQSHKKWLHH